MSHYYIDSLPLHFTYDVNFSKQQFFPWIHRKSKFQKLWKVMEREEPPPISSEESPEVKKDIFGDDEDDDLFKSAVEAKMGGGTNGKQEEDTSGYMTSEVARSNTLDDIEDNELFK